MQIVCLQLDLARQKENLPFIKSYIDFAAENGYNSLLLYLENNVRTQSTLYFDADESYSEAEIREIVAYAETKGIDVIPAFENLGHLERFFRYPAFAELAECKDAQKEGRGFYTGLGTCGCSSNPALYEVLDNYIREVCALFNSPYVHMGLDEPFDFAVCKRCKDRMERENKTKADLFYEHVMHSRDLVKSMGRTMMMWDDFFEYADIAHKLPRDIIFCNWNYYFISDEPSGHWTNRIKRDWFAYYDALGFKYIFCVYGHRASSLYNLESFTEYAEKYHPIGGMVTQWERSNGFYFATYPFLAVAGRKWGGQVCDENKVKEIFANLLGGEEQAELLLSLDIPTFYWGYNDVTNVCEGDYLLKSLYEKQLAYAVNRLRVFAEGATGLAKDILTDAFCYVYSILLDIRMQRLGVEIFNNYESGNKPVAYFFKKLDEMTAGWQEIEKHTIALWAKHKQGIKSFNNSLQKKFEKAYTAIERIRTDVVKNTQVGVLYTDLMLHDGYGTVRGEIRVKYQGEQKEKILYRGNVKPSLAGFEVGGCYNFRYLLEDKAVEYIVYGVFGEGALYPTHFRYTRGGKKYVADSVEILQGKVVNADKVLANDTRFAEMGYDDGVGHFNDLALAKQMHEIKITFKNLV